MPERFRYIRMIVVFSSVWAPSRECWSRAVAEEEEMRSRR